MNNQKISRRILCKISGSPLRFYGFLSFLLFLLTALWRWSDGIFQTNNWYTNLSPIVFVLASVFLYTIAYKTKDLKAKRPFLYRLAGSPIKLTALFLILSGALILIYLIAFIHFESQFIWFISAGVLLYLIELVFPKERLTRKKYWTVQFTTMALIGLAFLLAFLHATAKTEFITNNEKEFVIVYEMDAYPPLPTTLFWRKTIHIPDNGVLITSSSVLELPGYRLEYWDKKGKMIKMYRQYNSEYCANNKATMSVDYYASKIISYHIPCGQSDVQIAFQELFDAMCQGEIKSNFTNTRTAKNRLDSRDIWCKEYLENIEIFTKH